MIYNYSEYQKIKLIPNFENKELVYELVDPNTFEIRYVGMTNNLKSRYYSHTGKENSNRYKRNWVNKLRSENKFPIMRIIGIFINRKDAANFEKKKIAEYKSLNYKLTNITIGGEDGTGKHRCIPIVGMNIFTKEKIYFNSAAEASKNGFLNSCIGSCITGTKTIHRNFIWVKQKDENILEQKLIDFQNKDQWKSQRKKLKSVNIYTGKEIIYNSASEVRKKKLNYKRIIKAIKNPELIFMDCLWSYCEL